MSRRHVPRGNKNPKNFESICGSDVYDVYLVADGVNLDVLRGVVARPTAAHQHDGARVEGGQDRTQGRELIIQGATKLKQNWLEKWFEISFWFSDMSKIPISELFHSVGNLK